MLMLKYQMPPNEIAACPNMTAMGHAGQMSSSHWLGAFLRRLVFVGHTCYHWGCHL